MLEVESTTQLQSALTENDGVVVMFTQPRTCAPCRQLKPHFVNASEKSDLAFVVADLDKMPDAVVEFGIQSVPQVLLYRDGQFVKHIQGRTVVQILSELT
jgi:thioredoxin-like negative regulator of GroEL